MALYKAPGDKYQYYYAIPLDELSRIIDSGRKVTIKYGLHLWAKTIKSPGSYYFGLILTAGWLTATIFMSGIGHYDNPIAALMQSIGVLLLTITACSVYLLGYSIFSVSGKRGTSDRLAIFRQENPELACRFDSGRITKLTTIAFTRGLGREYKQLDRIESSMTKMLAYKTCDEQLKADVDEYILDTADLSVYSLRLEERADEIIRDHYFRILCRDYVERELKHIRQEESFKRSQKQAEKRESK